MFRVSTVHLAADATTAGPALGATELGELSREALLSLLERFRQIDALQIVDAEPHLLVTGRSGKFIVRTGRKKLFLYDARDSVKPYAELTPEEIVFQLEQDRGIAASPASPDGSPGSAVEPSARVGRPAPHRGIAATILIAGLALNGYTLYSAFYTESVNEKPLITLLTEPAELRVRTQAVVGTYITGDKTGDRTIVVQPDGHVKFSEIGATNPLLNNTDTYQLGKRGTQFHLMTAGSGVIDIADTDTVVYYRDVYKRR